VSDVGFDHRNDVLLAHLRGEIDIASAEHLQDEILSETRFADESGLVVDLSEVSFLDSSGVRLLFTVHRAMIEQGRPMALVVPRGTTVASVLSIVEMASVVWTSPTIDGAIEKLFPPEPGVHSPSS
jgi:anti-anti-sigma factor